MRTNPLPDTGGRGRAGSAGQTDVRALTRSKDAEGHTTGTVPPLQWWRNLPAYAYTDAHLMTLHRAIAGIGMIGEPRWADAAHGHPAAAVDVALRTVNDRTVPLPVLDLTMSTVLIAAINGSAAAISLLVMMIERSVAGTARKGRLERSWIEAQRAGRKALMDDTEKHGE